MEVSTVTPSNVVSGMHFPAVLAQRARASGPEQVWIVSMLMGKLDRLSIAFDIVFGIS